MPSQPVGAVSEHPVRCAVEQLKASLQRLHHAWEVHLPNRAINAEQQLDALCAVWEPPALTAAPRGDLPPRSRQDSVDPVEVDPH